MLTALAVGVVLGGCDGFGSSQDAASQQTLPGTPQSTFVPSQSTTEPKVIALPKLTEAHSIHIEDNWDGLNTAAPVLADYLLIRGADVFSGTGNFSMGGSDNGRPVTTAIDITIPIQDANTFLSTLEQARLEDRTDVPTATCCVYDDYPSFKIAVSLENNTSVVFQSDDNQGPFLATPAARTDLWSGLRGHRYWRVNVGTDRYISTSALPDEGLVILWKYIRKDEIEDKLGEELDKRR
jgi:hypothetical protein